ncbi:MAG: Rne/Rng family ribonuclease [Ilumatobacteraceae bacterium]|nr:Rne/Rng family ribonuclease [Ilumatobacter sp.]MCO5329083.1 Rne/Rng family ribonuclease [Ilumatobacteraceae bacterium]
MDNTETNAAPAEGGGEGDAGEINGEPTVRPGNRKRRRGSRGGRNRKRPTADGAAGDETGDDGDDRDDGDDARAGDAGDALRAARPAAAKPSGQRAQGGGGRAGGGQRQRAVPNSAASQRDRADQADQPELPDRISENRPSAAAADAALVRKPRIGDTRPAPAVPAVPPPGPAKPARQVKPKAGGGSVGSSGGGGDTAGDAKRKRRRGGKGRSSVVGGERPSMGPVPELDPDVLERRRGRERNGRPVGRYLMCVQVRPTLTQVAVLEGRNLIEHYVSRPADDIGQIHGNIYVGKVQNVLPGMEAAFVDIGTPKNAVLYRGDVQYNEEDIVEKSSQPRIEQMLKAKQLIVCQVTKNPIGAKGARLTQEVSLPGRFVVLIPNSNTYGISKRLPDDVRKRLRNILDRVKPAEHGLIVRTAAEHATEHELRADMTRLLNQWTAIEAKAAKAQGPALLYREPELAVRVIREEFNAEYRGVVIDDQRLFEDVRDYVGAFNPELADRVEYFDAVEDGLPLFERFHIHEQLHKALDRKVWLPSGGSLIIEHTEALTVIDVNTGKNVGSTNLEETVYKNNLEAAEEVAKQLRLRDIGGIVVIDFIDMEIKDNRRKVVDAFRSALARDKTRTQVFEISELGLVEMTRKRIGEGLLVNFADQCPNCQGRGVVIDHALLQ